MHALSICLCTCAVSPTNDNEALEVVTSVKHWRIQSLIKTCLSWHEECPCVIRVSPTAIWLLSHAFWFLYTVLPFHTLSITNASYYSTCTMRQRKNVGNTHWQPIMHIIQSVINYTNQSSWNRQQTFCIRCDLVFFMHFPAKLNRKRPQARGKLVVIMLLLLILIIMPAK